MKCHVCKNGFPIYPRHFRIFRKFDQHEIWNCSSSPIRGGRIALGSSSNYFVWSLNYHRIDYGSIWETSRFSKKSDENDQKMAQVEPPTQVFVLGAKFSGKWVVENPEIPGYVPSQNLGSFLVAEISRCLWLILLFSTQTPDSALRGHLETMLEESASHHFPNSSVRVV